jgi:hypothetical protein
MTELPNKSLEQLLDMVIFDNYEMRISDLEHRLIEIFTDYKIDNPVKFVIISEFLSDLVDIRRDFEEFYPRFRAEVKSRNMRLDEVQKKISELAEKIVKNG